ncbi:DEAD/DEAH box helicase [Aciduricibacillus chroicocephali]|uniref:DEAD/DEAH box helicase n=1 Tax=Aciduricibacillus chroicocephali TaxID=3054939 RepID=A0ABY9KTU8_9BACI|nr:DEAD/DEAH box helicase [Bacillaceae bacterium 44XB]
MACYEKNHVQELIYDRNNQIWNAQVEGSEKYFVEVRFTEGENQFTSHCDCPPFDLYGECKHEVAVLLAIAEYNEAEAADEHAFSKRDYDIAAYFMNSIAEAGHQETVNEAGPAKEQMQVEYIGRWTYGRLFYLEMKTGVKRRYVVRNLGEFLDDVFEGEEHEFTKKFTYDGQVHYFRPEDMEMLEVLHGIQRNSEIYDQPSFNYYHDELRDKRYVVVPPYAMKDLIAKLSKLNFVLIEGQKEYTEIAISEDQLPFQFVLEREDTGNDLVFTLEGTDGAKFYRNYDLVFQDGIFYFPNKKQLPIIGEMLRFSQGVKRMPVQKERADLFLSEVLPSLKNVGKVNIAEEISEEIIDKPLEAKLYLEMKETVIGGRLEYHYGKEVIEPFAGRKTGNQLILRDAAKEQKIMNLIEHANFRFNGKELYIEADDDTLYNFLYEVLPQMSRHLEVLMTNELRQFLVDTPPEAATNIRVDESANLLDIGFSIEGVSQDEVEAVLAAVIEKKRFYRLQSGAFLSLGGEEFQSVQHFFAEMDLTAADTVNGRLSLPMFRGMEVDELIDTKKVYDHAFHKLLGHLQSPERQDYPLPEQLNAELRSYQETGYQWFRSLSDYHFGGILADDMGLGKTLQSIAYIASIDSDKPHLIVAPSSVIYNWKNEVEKFAPHLRVAVMTGTPQEREEKIQEGNELDIWITSYQTLRQDIELYRELQFQTLILDEAQYIKNYQTKTSKAMREVKASRKFALSGTPIENSIDELWAIFQVIMPGLMPNHRKFKELSHEKIARMTRPFILRRLKTEVLTELPEKIESVQISELTKEQKELYIGYLNELRQETANSLRTGSFRENRMKILAGLTRLRQICCHPSLFLENYEGTAGKLEQLIQLIETLMESGKRMLIFSQFTSMHELIAKILDKRGIGYFYLHGQTKSKERVEICERFNNGENSIFLISLKAGGTGLNLTGADTVILYDLWWNPAIEDQAAGRAHRFGQKNVVQVMRLIAEGTIEEKIYALQQKKRELIDAVIQPGEAALTGITEDDVRELLSI